MLSSPQVSAAFQRRVQNKIKDLLQQMEEGLKTADPHDFSTYTGWTGQVRPALPLSRPPRPSTCACCLRCRHRLALPAAAPGIPRGLIPAEGAGLREEDHEDPERPQSDVPVRRRGAAGGGGSGAPQAGQHRRQQRLSVQASVCGRGQTVQLRPPDPA